MKYETIEAIDRHVREDTYFATVATILDLLQEELASEALPLASGVLRRLRDDLLYAQEHYRIVPRRTRR